MRNLVLVLGDQLSLDSAAFDGFDRSADMVWMAEVADEATHVRSHKARIALFLSAMRHFRKALKKRKMPCDYHWIDDPDNEGSFTSELRNAILRHRPKKLIVVKPGEWRVREDLLKTARELGVELEIRLDRHFICSAEDFADHAATRKKLLMEFFYREIRRKARILMDDDKPRGGKWNYDSQNRKSLPSEGPSHVPEPKSFRPNAETREALDIVSRKFHDHPGSLENFDWPVTPAQARKALDDFIANRLPSFGDYQDAMWTGEPYLYHSRLSAAMNLKLLDPRDAIEMALKALDEGTAPINSVEGFIRQIIGWREYVRGIYWHFMPEYANHNYLDADLPLPWFYWTAQTDMKCLRQCLEQTLQYGFAHHIQRLMVTGLFALLLGVRPAEVHEWYLAIYVDAVEWVELPNTIGMSQFADGGLMATKPYAATGAYIKRMSNYCRDCRYVPAEKAGEHACPFTALYWDFLMRNEKKLSRNPRMGLQLRNLARLEKEDRGKIRKTTDRIKRLATKY